MPRRFEHMIRYHLLHAADSLIHALWPHRHGAHWRPLPRWLKRVCDRYDAMVLED